MTAINWKNHLFPGGLTSCSGPFGSQAHANCVPSQQVWQKMKTCMTEPFWRCGMRLGAIECHEQWDALDLCKKVWTSRSQCWILRFNSILASARVILSQGGFYQLQRWWSCKVKSPLGKHDRTCDISSHAHMHVGHGAVPSGDSCCSMAPCHLLCQASKKSKSRCLFVMASMYPLRMT